MKTTTCVLAFLLTALSGWAQDARYETATGTNSITIADYESGELVSVLRTNAPGTTFPVMIRVQKDNLQFYLRASAAHSQDGALNSSGVGDVVRGPATFWIADTVNAHCFTIKITPVSFPPNQTLIVPPGTNQVQVSMETSTNLVSWATATNGVYGSPESVRFFRLKMTNLQP